MATLAPLLIGSLAAHPLAAAFATEVVRVHRRYAAEVVAAHRLCPFLHDVDTAFGRFVIALEPAHASAPPSASGLPGELDVSAATSAVVSATTQVVHIVYPCVRPPSVVFERFAAKLGRALKDAMERPPVMATFHPDLSGDTADAYRLIGVLRRAPDPFVQMIPAGLHDGGTVFAGIAETPLALAPPPVDSAVVNFERLRGDTLAGLLATLADVHADRARSYAPYAAAFGFA